MAKASELKNCPDQFAPPILSDDTQLCLHVSCFCCRPLIYSNEGKGRAAVWEDQDPNLLLMSSPALCPPFTVMLVGAVCQFCTGSLDLQEAPRGRSVQRIFVTASLQLLFLYVLNLVVMAALLPQDQLKLVPMLVAMFILGR